MTNITKRKVKSGENLWNIASEFGIPASQRNSELWKSWGYEGEPTNLPIGFTLNIPTPKVPVTSKDAIVPTSTKEVKDELKVSDDGFSASFGFLKEASKELKKISKATTETQLKEEGVTLTPAGGTPQQIALHKAQVESIKAETERSREEIEDVRRAAEVERGRALEMLSASPVTSRYAVESFVTKSDNFDKAINRSIERLQADENNAILNNNYAFAQQIRQERMDYYTLQRQMIQDNYNFLTSAYNMMLTGRQEMRAERKDAQTAASDFLETTTKAYAGSGMTMDTLPEEVSAQLLAQGKILGLSKDTIDRLLLGSAETSIITDAKTGWVMGIDKNTGNVIFKKLLPGRTGVVTETEPSLSNTERAVLISTKVTQELSDAPRNKDGYIDPNNYYEAMAYWRENSPLNLKTFFLDDPLDIYVSKDDQSTNPAGIELRTLEDAAMKADPITELFRIAAENIPR